MKNLTAKIQNKNNKNQISVGSILNLNKSQIKTLDRVDIQNNKLEFLYVRENRLREIKSLDNFVNLKIFDASQNEINFLQLPSLPFLKEIYLSCNKIKNLEHFPSFPQLEILSLSENEIETLEGMNLYQPSLKAFFVTTNRLTNFCGFPIGFHLEVFQCFSKIKKKKNLRISNNPISKEQSDICILNLLLIYPNLQKLDGTNIHFKRKEYKEVKLPTILFFAIRRGFIYSGELNSSLFNECFNFITEHQRIPISNQLHLSSCQLKEIEINGDCIEGNQIISEFYFTCKDHIHRDHIHKDHIHRDIQSDERYSQMTRHVKYQWFRILSDMSVVSIPGATSKNFILQKEDVDYCLKVECTTYLPNSILAFSFYNYTNQVIASNPKIASADLQGLATEGENMKVNYRYIGGEEGISLFRWFRCYKDGREECIQDVDINSSIYFIIWEDFGASIKVEITPVRVDGKTGESVILESSIIEAKPPVIHAKFVGNFIEGEEITIEKQYKAAAPQYLLLFKWQRIPYSEETTINHNNTTIDHNNTTIDHKTNTNSSLYILNTEDVGKILRVEITPVDIRGIRGIPCIIESPVVLPAFPKIEHLKIVGKCEEGNALQVDGRYFGGKEGESKVIWFRNKKKKKTTASFTTSPSTTAPSIASPSTSASIGIVPHVFEREDESESEEITSGNKHCQYVPSLDDVGFYLFACYIPIREDGVYGEKQFVSSSAEIAPADPQILDLQLIGSCVEGSEIIAKYKYLGGEEGKSKFAWYQSARSLEYFHKNPIPGSQSSRVYFPTKEDIGKILKFTYTPIRIDGKIGTNREIETSVIQAALPSITNVFISRLQQSSSEDLPQFEGKGVYVGGEEGKSKLQWIKVITDEKGIEKRTKTKCNSTIYKASKDELEDEYQLCFSYTPIRSDGVVGNTVFSSPVFINPSAFPRVENAFLEGNLIESSTLYFRGNFIECEEKDCQFTWSRRKRESQSYELIANATDKCYKLVIEDVDCYLCCQVSVSKPSLKVKACTAETLSCIEPGSPEIINISILGNLQQNSTLTCEATYFGGKQGNVTYKWYKARKYNNNARESTISSSFVLSESFVPIGFATNKSVQLSVDEFNHFIKVECTPIRSDGKVGRLAFLMTSSPVSLAPNIDNQLKTILVVGEATFNVLIKDAEVVEEAILVVAKQHFQIQQSSKTILKEKYHQNFQVFIQNNDEEIPKLKIDSENYVLPIVAQSTTERDLIVVVLRTFAGQYWDSIWY